MLPLVYSIVLNHNGEVWLERCLLSLLSCPYPNLRIVLLDNGSTDGSVGLARSLSERIEIIETGANLGFCGGNNVGIRHALERGAGYVALLNNDTYFEPDWLLRLIEVGERNPRLGALGPVHLVFDGCEFNSWITSAYPALLDTLREQDRPGVWLSVQSVEGSCLAVKREVFERIGLLDPIFFAFFEEFDFCRRARAAGYQVGIVPASKIHHHRGGFYGQKRALGRRAFFMMQSSMIYSCSDPGASLLGNLKGLLGNNATQLKQALLGQESLMIWCRASLSLFKRFPALYRKWRADRETVARCRLRLTDGSAPYPPVETASQQLQ